MAGQRQPTDLVVMNGRKHLTKAEIEARKNAEVTAPCDKVRPPSYLTPEQKKQFRKIAKELLEIKLISNLDCDALARLLIAQTQYIEITEQIRATPLMEDVPVYEMRENPDTGEKERVQVGTRQVVSGERERLMIIQDRCMKQCRQGASDFGLTVSPLPFGRTETTTAKAGEQICEICKLRHGKSRRNTRPLHTIRP